MTPLSRLDSRQLFGVAVALAVLLGVALTVPEPVWADGRTSGPAGSAHLHASLFIHVAGEEIEPTRAFLDQAQRVHFHAQDSILHVHATGLTIGHALDTLPVTVDGDCLTVTGTRTCAATGDTVTVLINGEPVDPTTARSRIIRQGDTITLFLGDDPQTLPDRYHDRVLPEKYRPSQPGSPV